MTGIELELEIIEISKKTLKDLRLQKPFLKDQKESEYGEVRVYSGFPLPLARTDEKSDIPFVVLRASEGSDKETQTIVKINAEILTYKNDDKQDGYIGHRNAIMIWEKIRQRLRTNRSLGIFTYLESKWEILKLDNELSGVAVDISFETPLIKEEENIIDGLIG